MDITVDRFIIKQSEVEAIAFTKATRGESDEDTKSSLVFRFYTSLG